MVVLLAVVDPTFIVNVDAGAIEIAPFTNVWPTPVLLITELAAANPRLEKEPLATVTLPVDDPLNVRLPRENAPGRSFVAKASMCCSNRWRK